MRTEWNTREELLEDFLVEGFAINMCVVVRKSDGQKGVLDFTHMPRVYFNFQPF